jgi:WD40 repeat protein/predicted Ser/Thr protein kinase
MIHSGLLLQNRYRVLKRLGKGGFGETFEVDDRGTPKVLKVLNLSRFDNLEAQQKAVSLFKREAAVLIRLKHPGIPKVQPDGYFTLFDAIGEPVYCLVMEKIEGLNLRQWLEKRENQPITQHKAIAWLKQMSELLAQVHQQELVHRDIKPDNIMLRPSGQLVLIDFGAVREVTDSYLQGHTEKTTGTAIISLGYTPPEQAEGKAVPQSDFFALGRTFVYLLTGKHPTDFDTDPRTGRLDWRNSAPQVSRQFAGLIDYLMNPFSGQRPKSPQMILCCLEEITSPQYLPPLPSPTPVTRPSKATTTGKHRPFFGFVSSFLPSFLPTIPLTNPWHNTQLHRTLSGHSDVIRSVAISPDGQTLVSGSYDRTIKLWALYTGKLLRTLPGHSHRVTCISISPDGRTLASSSYDRTIKLWALRTGDLLYTLSGHSGRVRYIAFSPDGKTLISSGGEIKVWAVHTGKLLRTLAARSHADRLIAFNPDGKTCVTGSLDGTIELWNPYTGERLLTFSSRLTGITALAFSPDGEVLASGGGTTIELWNPHSNKRLGTFSSQSSGITSVAFSPDGEILASGSGTTIELWNLHPGKQLCTLSGHSHSVRAVAFSPNGRILVSGSYDKTIKIWQSLL